DHPDPSAANAQALHDLEQGANGLSLVFAGAIGAYGYGLPCSEADVARVLDGVLLDAGIAIELDLGLQAAELARSIARVSKQRGIGPASREIRFGPDPLGAMAARGASARPWADAAAQLAATIADLAAAGFKGPFAAADGRPVHAAGGSEAQELAFALSVAVAY